MHELIGDSVYILYGTGYSSNSILVQEETTFLVDPGMGNIKSTLSQIGIQPSDINEIVNTHCHYDHIANNRLFSCPVYAMPPDLGHIMDADATFTGARMFMQQLEKMKNCRQIPLNYHGWKVIPTPGHTQGSFCLLKDGVLISGDTLFADGYGRTDLPGGSDEQMNKSLLKLENMGYNTLLPGHGEADRR